MPLLQRLREFADRTQLVFIASGLLFASSVWAYFYGIACKTPEGFYQYDAVSILPGILAFSCFLALNLLVDRSVLLEDGMDYFSGNNIRVRRFFVFSLFILTMTSIAIAVLMGLIRYKAKDWTGMSWGLSLETVLMALSSFLIFFGRKLDVVYF